MKRNIILDTSVFVNPASAQTFGHSPTVALTAFLRMAHDVEGVNFYMPPSIYAELMHFAEESQIPKTFLLLLQQKPPKRQEARVPGVFIYELVESIRDRVDRGLRLSERHVREALQLTPPPKEHVRGANAIRPDAEVVSRLRESYRRIMREGMLDSKADVDLLLLAYEIDGILVSADQGVLLWAEKLGITILPYDQLIEFLAKHTPKKVL
jgi:RNA ligase partner protein